MLRQKERWYKVEELTILANSSCILPRNTSTILAMHYNKNNDRTIELLNYLFLYNLPVWHPLEVKLSPQLLYPIIQLTICAGRIAR